MYLDLYSYLIVGFPSPHFGIFNEGTFINETETARSLFPSTLQFFISIASEVFTEILATMVFVLAVAGHKIKIKMYTANRSALLI